MPNSPAVDRTRLLISFLGPTGAAITRLTSDVLYCGSMCYFYKKVVRSFKRHEGIDVQAVEGVTEGSGVALAGENI